MSGLSVAPNDTTYNYLCQLVYLLSERHILNDNITSKYVILDELYEALAFDRNPAPNRLVYYNDTMLNDPKYAVGSTFCGGTITGHIYNNNIKAGAIEFDRTVTDLENAAFRNTHINSISLPTEVVTIGDNAFFQCYYLEGYSWNLPATVTTIGDYAFASTDIRELSVPAGTTSIGHAAFTGIKNIVYTGSASYGQNDPYWGAKMANGVWESSTGNLYSADGTIFACVGYPDDTTSLTVASGVTTIGRDAVRNCTHLTSVTLPSSLTTIQSGAFIQCTGLPAITIPSGVTSIGAFAFSGDTSLTITMLPTVPPTLAGSSEFNGVQKILVYQSVLNTYQTEWSAWSSIIEPITAVSLNVTSDTTLTERGLYENINVSNNAVLTISDTFVQALDTITVEAGSQIRVLPTSVLVAGEGGIVTADVDGLYLETINENTGTVVFNVSSSNTQPYATLEMSFDAYLGSNDTLIWDHIACPMLPGYTRQSFSLQMLNEWTSNGWAYTGAGISDMVPYKAYNIAVNKTYPGQEPIHTPGTIMLFKGNLQGNTDYTLNLTNGTNPLGNAYTARIPIKYLLEKLNAVQGTAEVLWGFPTYDVTNQQK